MADEADMGNEMAELHLKTALQNMRSKPKLKPKGLCYFCTTPLETEELSSDIAGAEDPHKLNSGSASVEDPAKELRKLYCDSDCAEDHAKELRLRNRH